MDYTMPQILYNSIMESGFIFLMAFTFCCPDSPMGKVGNKGGNCPGAGAILKGTGRGRGEGLATVVAAAAVRNSGPF